MTKHWVKNVSIQLKEGQCWELHNSLMVDDEIPTKTIRILALGKDFAAVEDINCDSHFIIRRTKVIGVDTILRSVDKLLKGG